MRTSGILMPIFSLPSKYGIGTLGEEAFRFVDFLKQAGQSYWQILPIGPTSYGDSPYQSFSSYAGNPYFVDLDLLKKDGLLTQQEIDGFDFGDTPSKVDYEKLYQNRLPLLKLAFARFTPTPDYTAFCEENAYWLSDYALFMALKNANGGVCWANWDKPLRLRETDAIDKAKAEHDETIRLYQFIQYQFHKQWVALKTYANEQGIGIIGDIPIYVAYDSTEVWSEPDQFQLDKENVPTAVAGVPPDGFSADGQLWGNPLYHWKQMKRDGYRWWKQRIGYALTVYDKVRIDHFRAFAGYFSVPYGEETAKNGKWEKGPGIALFKALEKDFGKNLPIIAEDLGFLTPDVLKLLKDSGFPGMKVLQFAFDTREESDYLPHNYTSHCVVYTGTHDNDTIMGWTESANKEDVEMAKRYMHFDDNDRFNWAMMRLALMSVADTCILMMPDLLGLGSEGRINTPSILGGNWFWRIDGGCINDWLAQIVKDNTALYGRLPKA